jgi:hypothetical protein
LVGLSAGLNASENDFVPLPGIEMIPNTHTDRICNYFVHFVNGIGPVVFSNSETKLGVPTLLMPKPATIFQPQNPFPERK